jgi:multidrug resistance efflux pump
MDRLYRQEAVTKQQWDRAQADREQAQAQRREAEEAWKRAEEGTRSEQKEQARQAYQQARAALDLVQAGTRREDIQAAAAELSEAHQNLELLERGTRPEDIQAGKARLAQAQAALAALEAGSRREQIAQARAAAQAAQASARSVQISLAERIVRAPRDGVVERIPVAVGDLVNAGMTVVRLANPGDLWIRVYVPEADLAKVRVGDDAALRVDGVTGTLAGTVESIATQGEFTPANLQTPDERGKQVFGVRLRLKQRDPRVKEGMYGTVTRLGQWEP